MTVLLLRFVFLLNAASVLFAEEGGGKGYGDIPGFGDKVCPNFRCSTGQVPVPKARGKFTSLGCSAMGGGMMIAAGTGEVEAYSPCCDLWHACYQTCGSPKKMCDEAFTKCSEKACGTNEKCTKSAEMKIMMLQFGGCEKYNEAQYQGCDCVSKDKAEGKRSDALEYFYKMHAPKSQGSPVELAKKADSTAKMAALMRKLLAKYPKAIKIKKDPQQEYMENIMRQTRDEKETEDVQIDEEGGDSFDDSDEKIEL